MYVIFHVVVDIDFAIFITLSTTQKCDFRLLALCLGVFNLLSLDSFNHSELRG